LLFLDRRNDILNQMQDLSIAVVGPTDHGLRGFSFQPNKASRVDEEAKWAVSFLGTYSKGRHMDREPGMCGSNWVEG
jgi:hypothetical protein